MIPPKAVIIEEELINVKALTKLIANYCKDQRSISSKQSDENIILEINSIKPDIALLDIKPLILIEVVKAVSNIIKNLELQNFIPIEEDSKNKYREYVALSSLDQIDFIKMADIMFCMADGKYTKFYLANGNSFLSSKPIGSFEYRVLDSDHFFRIHNSYIINMRFVAKVNKKEGIACEMLNGLSIPISKRRQQDFNKFIRLKD